MIINRLVLRECLVLKIFLINNMVEKELGIPTYIRNDAHLLALADRDAFKDISKNMLYIAYRTGIGMAIFKEGLLYDGDCGNAGYLGHTMFDKNGDTCYCGKKGCLELYCSKVSMLKKYNGRSGYPDKLTFQDLLTRANKGEVLAFEIVREAAACFGIAIANTVKLFDVSLVIIGDLPDQANGCFLQTIEKTVNDNVTYCRDGKVSILHGRVDESAYALGGCIFMIDKFFKMPTLRLKI